MWGKKPEKAKQVIKEEPMDVNPMQQLAMESEQDMPPVPKPLPIPKLEAIPTPAVPVENEGLRWVVGEIATSTEKVIHDKATQMNYDIYSAIALILNKAYEE